MNLASLAGMSPLAAALPDHPGFGESVVFQLNGLVVVFTALGAIWLLVEAMAFWFKRRVTAPGPVAAPAWAPGGPDPAMLAALAAAAHVALGGSPRITSIVRVDTPDHEWVLEGRRQIHSARKVR